MPPLFVEEPLKARPCDPEMVLFAARITALETVRLALSAWRVPALSVRLPPVPRPPLLALLSWRVPAVRVNPPSHVLLPPLRMSVPLPALM